MFMAIISPSTQLNGDDYTKYLMFMVPYILVTSVFYSRFS
jgi:hypothetical protein